MAEFERLLDALRFDPASEELHPVWGGRLTAWIAEEDRLLQVPAARRHAVSKD